MNVLLMSNFSNPRYRSVMDSLYFRGHNVTSTEDHRKMNLSYFDIGISWYYRVIVKQPELDAFKYGVYNYHPGHLPECRGAFTNIFPIVCKFPAGVSMQKMDAGLDTGPMISRRTVAIFPTDTGETLWHKLVEAQYRMFIEDWPLVEKQILDGELWTYPQEGEARTWKMSDTGAFDNLDTIPNSELVIDILRARTFPPHESAYIVRNGRKIGVRVQLEDLGPA